MAIDHTQLEVWQLRYYDENPSRGGSMIPYKTFVAKDERDARRQLKQYIKEHPTAPLRTDNHKETIDEYLSHYRDFVRVNNR